MSALGLDIGGSSVKAAMLDPGAEPRTARAGAYARPSLDEIREAIEKAAEDVCREAAPDRVGLCLPGRYSADEGCVVASVNAPSLVGLPIEDLLPASLRGLPRVVASDAEAAARDARAEWGWRDRVLAISIGTGVGACVLDDSGPLRVSGASSGHFGQMDVGVALPDGSTPIGPDGGRGSLEAYIGLPALRARFPDVKPGELPGMLRPRDPALVALARGVRIAHAIYRPRWIALLGGIGVRLSDEAIGFVDQAVRDALTGVARPEWSIRKGEHDHHAAFGAARLAMERV